MIKRSLKSQDVQRIWIELKKLINKKTTFSGGFFII
jgi:hypothetical protein